MNPLFYFHIDILYSLKKHFWILLFFHSFRTGSGKGVNIKCKKNVQRIISRQVFIGYFSKNKDTDLYYFSASLVHLFIYNHFMTVFQKAWFFKQRSEYTLLDRQDFFVVELVNRSFTGSHQHFRSFHCTIWPTFFSFKQASKISK